MDECYIAYIELQIEQITLKNFENRFHFENQIAKTSQVFLLFVMIYLPKCTLSNRNFISSYFFFHSKIPFKSLTIQPSIKGR